MTIRQLHQLVQAIYEGKAAADAEDDKNSKTPVAFHWYVFEFMLQKYGVKTLAVQHSKTRKQIKAARAQVLAHDIANEVAGGILGAGGFVVHHMPSNSGIFPPSDRKCPPCQATLWTKAGLRR
ncbi:MAG: hypothetical protein HOM58_03225 [Rhodospirillaceae bacterium]|nr:hypothetical protein [Rhodospirillaceae bacterium]